ncbi:MAG TPA: immunoglobulin domain-containing protein [Candidatus Saccharimonadales bacterium]|nr:immunoglobulin domain-containing protein [Candidatus Saccharimonadales bacterium]
MKLKTRNRLSLAVAGLLPFMPILRSTLPAMESAGSPTGAWVLRWTVGVAICGYDAISRASSVAISPPSATIGVPYSGTVTYSGGHAGAVVSMSVAGSCLGSHTLAPGLTMTYSGVNTANVIGTPSGTLGTVPFTVTVYDGYSCTGGLTDTRSTSLIIQNSGGGPVAPSMTVAPQSTLAQVGSDVLLSGGASGNPTPKYYWKQGISLISGATNNTLLISGAQLADAGVYTLYASNSQGQANSACDLTMALTPGSNILALLYTNYFVAGTPVTMSSLITNVPSGVNTYSWQYNNSSIGVTTSNLSLTAAQTVPSKSGTYSVTFNSVVGSTTVVDNQQYNSYWIFGYPPSIASQPAAQNANPGDNVTFSFTLGGGNYPAVFLYQNQTNLVAQTNLPAYNPATGASTTNLSLTIANVTQASQGSYTFVVTNFWGSITSSAASLTMASPLSVTAPQSQTNYAGKNVSLSVTASGAAPFAYQWQKGGVGLANGGAISGATTNALSIAPAMVTDSGSYQVIVTNTVGSVTSSVAVVSIVPVPQFAASLAGNNVTLSAAGGVAGSNYVVQVSTNLANPAGWAPLQTNVVPPNGSITFTDTNSATSVERFYRVQFP